MRDLTISVDLKPADIESIAEQVTARLAPSLERQKLADRVFHACGALGDAINNAVDAGLEVELTRYESQGRPYPNVEVREVIRPSPDTEDAETES